METQIPSTESTIENLPTNQESTLQKIKTSIFLLIAGSVVGFVWFMIFGILYAAVCGSVNTCNINPVPSLTLTIIGFLGPVFILGTIIVQLVRIFKKITT